jgi:hypothetical protein
MSASSGASMMRAGSSGESAFDEVRVMMHRGPAPSAAPGCVAAGQPVGLRREGPSIRTVWH